MPALGNRGAVNPNKIKAAAKKPAPPIRSLPATPTKPVGALPGNKAHTAFIPPRVAKGAGSFQVDLSKPGGRKTFREGQKALASARSQTGALGPTGTGIAANALGLGKALVHNPVGTVEHTITSLPKIGEGVAGQYVRMIGQTATGHPLKAGEEFVKGAAGYTKHLLGESVAESQKEAEKEGAAGKILTFAGGATAGGRVAGSALRTLGSQAEKGGIRGGLAKAGSTVRPPLALTDEAGLAKQGFVKQRTYSKDAGRKAVQVAVDKRRETVKDAQGKTVTYKDPRGREVPVLKASPREQEKFQGRRANFESSRAQGVENLERVKAQKASRKIQGRPVRSSMRLGQELSHLVATGTIRSAETFREDLQKRIASIEAAVQHPESFRTKDELKAAQQNLKLLRKAADNPTILANAPHIVQNGLRYAEVLNGGDRRLAELNVHPESELERSRLGEYAVSHMGARYGAPREAAPQPAERLVAAGEHRAPMPAERIVSPRENGAPVVSKEEQLLDARGRPLTNEQIRAHAHEAGRHPDTLAYLPHVLGAGRKSSFHVPYQPGKRPVFPGKARTFALYKRGSTAFGSELAREELTKKGVTAANAQAIDKFISESGLREPGGGYFTAKKALETAERLNADGETEYYPVRAFAAKLDKDTQQKLRESQSPAALETAHLAMLNDRIVKGPDDASRTPNVVLVPKHQLDTLARHLKAAGETEKLFQLLNGPFRMAVLPQPRWLTGNFVEPHFVRLPLSGAGVNIPGSAIDFAAAEKTVRGMERSGNPDMARSAQEIRGVQMGGMLIGRRNATIRRTHQDFPGDMGRALYAAHVVRNLPVTRQMGDLVTAIPKTFFAFNRAVVEGPVQRVAFGKQVREDIQQITGSWAKTITLGKKALEDVQKGLVNTGTQHRFMEEQFKLLGQYDAFNPRMRSLVQTAFPFLPWTLNSLRFVFWTLPAEHTAAFAALAAASHHVQAEWEAEHKYAPPGTLKEALVRKDKGLVDLARYTPFGVSVPLAQGQFEGLPSTFMPQLSGLQEAVSGRDPFGRELQAPKTKSNPKGNVGGLGRVGVGVNQTAESVIPLLAMIRRLQEKGGTSYSTSTALTPQSKPGTSHGMSAAERTLSPFRPTYVRPPKTPKGKTRKPKLGPSGTGRLGPSGGGGLGPTP